HRPRPGTEECGGAPSRSSRRRRCPRPCHPCRLLRPGVMTPGDERMMEYSYQIAPAVWRQLAAPARCQPRSQTPTASLWAPAEDDERWRVIRRQPDVLLDEEWPWFPPTLPALRPLVRARSAPRAAPT